MSRGEVSPLLEEEEGRVEVVVAGEDGSAAPSTPSVLSDDDGDAAYDGHGGDDETAALVARGEASAEKRRRTREVAAREASHASLWKTGGEIQCLHWPVREEACLCGLWRHRRIGAMIVVAEWIASDGRGGGARRRLLLGPYWHFLAAHVLVLALIAALVFGGVVPAHWHAARAVGLLLSVATVGALAATALVDPGVFPRYFSRVEPDWTYSEYAHAFRPPGTIFCQECQVLIRDYNHFCPWSGTAIGRGNEPYFRAFLVCLVATLVFDLSLVALALLDGG